MCDTVYMTRTAMESRTASDLRAAGFDVRRDDVAMPDGVVGWLGVCLCVVDVEAILDRSGRPWSYDIESGWIVE